MIKRSELMERAAEILEESGWVKGSLGTRQSGLCLLGASYEAMAEAGCSCESSTIAVDWTFDESEYYITTSDVDSPEKSRNVEFVNESIEPVLPKGVDVPRFNDHFIANQQEAIDTLIGAAKHWRDRGE